MKTGRPVPTISPDSIRDPSDRSHREHRRRLTNLGTDINRRRLGSHWLRLRRIGWRRFHGGFGGDRLRGCGGHRCRRRFSRRNVLRCGRHGRSCGRRLCRRRGGCSCRHGLRRRRSYICRRRRARFGPRFGGRLGKRWFRSSGGAARHQRRHGQRRQSCNQEFVFHFHHAQLRRPRRRCLLSSSRQLHVHQPPFLLLLRLLFGRYRVRVLGQLCEMRRPLVRGPIVCRW